MFPTLLFYSDDQCLTKWALMEKKYDNSLLLTVTETVSPFFTKPTFTRIGTGLDETCLSKPFVTFIRLLLKYMSILTGSWQPSKITVPLNRFPFTFP